MLAIPLSLFGAGQKEDKIVKAENLIKEKEYNEALLVLAEVIKEEPDRFGDAVYLANQIRAIRDRYNTKYNELIDALYNQQDVDKGLGIIAEMEALDPHPNPVTVDSIKEAKSAAELVANLNFFSKIMDEALSQIKSGKYSVAITTYLSVFSDTEHDLHRNDFKNEGYGNIVETSIDQALAGVISTGTDAQTLYLSSGQKMTALLDGLLTDDEVLRSRNTGEFLDTLLALRAIASKGDQHASVFKNQSDALRNARENAKGILFLKYTYQLIEGRQSSAGNEGIVYAIRSMGDDYADRSIVGLEVLTDSQMSNGLGAYSEQKFTDSGKSFTSAVACALPLVDISYFFDRKDVMSADFKKQYQSEWIVDPTLPRFMRAQEKIRSARTYYDVGVLREFGSKYKGILKSPTIAECKTIVSDIRSLVTNLSKIANDWDKYGKLASAKRGPNFVPDATKAAIETCDAGAAASIADYTNILSLVHKDETTAFEKEKSLLVSGMSDASLGIVFYPDRRRTALSKLLDDETFLGKSINAVKTEWIAKDDVLLLQARTTDMLVEVDKLNALIASTLVDINDQVAKADSNIIQAKKYKELGDIRNREALAELKKENYTTARDKIREATDAYYQSLSLQEDSDLRNNKLKALIDLLAQIQKTENERVVREVRKLIESSKDHYVKGEFEQAQDSLYAALSRWSDTQTEENPEIKDWLAYVKSALSIKSERELSEKSPLYKDISQLYNLAKEDYNNAVERLKAGANAEALLFFNSAQQKLLKITQQFPYNKDARLLTLLILKLTNPTDYANQFLLRIANARAALVSNRDLQSAYNDLKDLEALDPNYAGMKSLVFEFEVRLHLKMPPPDPANIKRSNELSEQARPIVEKRQIDLFNVARDLLNEALKLYPDNKKAKELLDSMGIYAGQQSIPKADMQKFYQADQLYQAKKNLEALAIMNDLVTRHPGYYIFVELLKKIKAALGQE